LDVATYFLQKEREFADAGCVPDESIKQMFQEEEGSGGLRGRVFATLALTEDTYVRVYERVAVRRGHITREVYSYSIVIDGAHVRGWERDPRHDDSPVHEHGGPNRERERGTKPIALKRVLEIAWDEVSLRAEALSDDS
jgi:hypothetical protein